MVLEEMEKRREVKRERGKYRSSSFRHILNCCRSFPLHHAPISYTAMSFSLTISLNLMRLNERYSLFIDPRVLFLEHLLRLGW